MQRVQFIEHKGKKILSFDFSGCKADDVAGIIKEAQTAIATQPPASVRVLTNVTDTEMSRATSDLMKGFTTFNKPYVACSAVVGVMGLKKVIYNAILVLTGRHIATFDTLEAAKEWLAAQ